MGAVVLTLATWLRAGEHLDEAGRLVDAALDPRRPAGDRRGSLSLAWAALGDACELTHEVAAAAPRMAARCRLRLQLLDAIGARLFEATSAGAPAPPGGGA